jgi:uncharacterized protein (DUF302 family)/uncharacterized membrane protein YidH (DUF202 family)
MERSPQPAQKLDLRDSLAAERTFLAWIRTGLALMGFGFVVARFGLFLQQFGLVQRLAATPSYGFSLWFGTALIFVGVLVNLGSTWSHVRLLRQLEQGIEPRSRASTLAIILASFLAIVGLAMAIYLITVRASAGVRLNFKEESLMPYAAIPGMLDKPSHHSVDQTVEKLKGILQAKGVTLFALVDHSGEAEKAGIKMPPTKLLIFGSPKAGTPLMLASPSIAIDLPLKILVWEDPAGKVWVSYNTPAYLEERHSLPPEFLQSMAVVETLAAKAAE